MELAATITDRHALVKFLHDEIKQPVEYAGAPTFNYTVGPYTVLRNANIRVSSDCADPALIEKMRERGYLEKEDQNSEYTYPIGDEVLTRVNLINTIGARGYLINKAIGQPNAFHVSKQLVRELKEQFPANVAEFNRILIQCGGDRAMKGIIFTADQAIFTGFPENRPVEELNAYHDLAKTLVAVCGKAKWLKGEAVETQNEKYSFRCWMNSNGLAGKEHAATRHILLERLSGDSAFRTKEQREAATAKRERKESRYERNTDFTVLG